MLGNCIKKVLLIIALGLIAAGAFLAFAEEVKLGGKAGWPVFQSQENITTGKGRFGYDCIELASNSFVFDDYTDLLINFENSDTPIADGDYRILANSLKSSNQTKNGKYSGLSRNIGGLTIEGNPGTFFGSEGLMGSFSIEFWLRPSLAENGENIVSWQSSKVVDGRLVYQVLSGSFNKGHMEWALSNFFDFYGDAAGAKDIILKGTSKIIPENWSYHVLSYDCETGCLEYLVNGSTEDFRYITSTGTEEGDVSLVLLGTPAELTLCQEYTGKIDDFRIMRRAYEIPDFQDGEGGTRQPGNS